MSRSRDRSGNEEKSSSYAAKSGESSSYLFGGFWVLLFLSTLMVGGPWAGYHAVLLGGAAVLMFVFPPAVSLPRLWWIFALGFVVAGMGAFLPVAWFPAPAWRGKLEGLGLETGTRVVIQSRQAAETFFLFVITLLTGLWLAGHRLSAKQVRIWALAFTIGVAAFALFSKIRLGGDAGEVFGFFPNRNHTATYLAMGCVCGLGCILQALRDRSYAVMGVALVATCLCFWAVAGWSISRGGVLLTVIGSLGWVSMLGKKYLGKHGMRMLGLLALAAVGFFFIADSVVKQRLTQTVDKAKVVSPATENQEFAEGRTQDPSEAHLDFRVPVALDTLDLIRDFKWTGVGAGQFEPVFPQYRKLTAAQNKSMLLHPENDWLWMAAETGVPATLALSALVVFAFWRALSGVLGGRDRALRGACLIAALLVPLHGLFDVPGHRIPLAWSSAFLFVLALHMPDGKRFAESVMRRWAFRGAAVGIAAYALFLARAEWWGGPQPAQIQAEVALKKAVQLHAEDERLLKAAKAAGQPVPDEHLLVDAVKILEDARKVTPMHRHLLRVEGMISLAIDNKQEFVDRCFAIERALDPTYVDAPLLQARSWARYDPARAAVLWSEALARAKELDRTHPDTQWSEWRVHERIRLFSKGMPQLEGKIPPQ